MSDYYLPTHRTQFDGSTYASSNCTPTSGADGLAAATGGRINLSGGTLRSYLPRSMETNPKTPGWSLQDLQKAVARLPATWKAPAFIPKTGNWTALARDLDLGYFVVLQGDSDQFGNGTCSGVFNGDHAVGLHPLNAAKPDVQLGDPICTAWREERATVLTNYAAKLSGSTARLRYGIFATAVPKAEPASYTLHIGTGTKEIWAANFSGTCIASWTKFPWSGKASTAPCKEPVYRKGCSSGGATVALVTAGAFAGKWVRIKLDAGTWVSED